MKAPMPWNEWERLAALKKYEILDTAPEVVYDRITKLASRVLGAPIALISLLDEKRQWFKSACGINVTETDRDLAFCAYAILGNSVMCVPDTLEDHRFRDHVMVTGFPHVRFYAGAPLRSLDGFNIGTLCLIDSKPRTALSADETATLEDLAGIVMDELELRIASRALSTANTKLALLAGTDPLTDLPNRLAFDQELRRHLAERAGEPLAVMYLDLDRFKRVNDSFGGHAAGDQLLRRLGQQMCTQLPQGAMLARVGGDEFIALVPGADFALVEKLARRICESLEKPAIIGGKSFSIGVSVGVAMFPMDSVDPVELVRLADRAMYQSKQRGGNCFEIVSQFSR